MAKLFRMVNLLSGLIWHQHNCGYSSLYLILNKPEETIFCYCWPNSLDPIPWDSSRILLKIAKILYFANLYYSCNHNYHLGCIDYVRGKLNVNDIGLANQGAIDGAQIISRLVREGIIPESTDRSIAFNKMKKGELAMTIDGPWAINDLKKAGIPFAVAPIPSIGGMTPRPFVGVHGFMIRRSSKKKDLAQEFVEKYLVSKKGVSLLYEMDPRGPSRYDVMKELGDDPALSGFLKSAAKGLPMPNVPQMGAVWGAMGAALRHVISGKQGPPDALKNAKKQILSSLEKK